MATTGLQRRLEAYIKQTCPEGWQAGLSGRRATALPKLSATDKALIYHYSEDGYESLNARLHATGGLNISLFGVGLADALTRLPAYVGEVTSGVYLSKTQLKHYQACALNGMSVSWPAFLSTSLRPGISMCYLRSNEKNCLFVIQSLTGRLIEEVAKYGVDGQNEYEVLFTPNTKFEVLQVVPETDYTRIVLDELP